MRRQTLLAIVHRRSDGPRRAVVCNRYYRTLTVTRRQIRYRTSYRIVARGDRMQSVVLSKSESDPKYVDESRYSKLSWLTCLVLVWFHIMAAVGVVPVHLDQPVRRGVPLLGRHRAGHQHGLSPAAYPSRVQDLSAVRLLPRGLRHADARRRPDLLGRHPSPAPSALRPA